MSWDCSKSHFHMNRKNQLGNFQENLYAHINRFLDQFIA